MALLRGALCAVVASTLTIAVGALRSSVARCGAWAAGDRGVARLTISILAVIFVKRACARGCPIPAHNTAALQRAPRPWTRRCVARQRGACARRARPRRAVGVVGFMHVSSAERVDLQLPSHTRGRE